MDTAAKTLLDLIHI